MAKITIIGVLIGSLLLASFLVYGQQPVDPPCFRIAAATTKICAEITELVCPDPSLGSASCIAANYRSPPVHFPRDVVRASSGTIVEDLSDCWYTQECVYATYLNWSFCFPFGDLNWNSAMRLQDDSENKVCEDPDFTPAPEL